jgi:hypothetical protein
MKKNQIISLVLLFFIASCFIISCKKDDVTNGSGNCSFTYSAWTTCSNGTQTRTYTSSPAGCAGTPPADSLTRSCGTPACTFTYSAWTTCSNGTQTRTYTSSPIGCTGTPPADSLTRSCGPITYSFTYGAWSNCDANNIQTRSYVSNPLGGTPPTDSISRTITISFSQSVSNVTCGTTATNGSITVTANGGVTPYTYSKNNGTSFQPSNIFSTLTMGSYPVVVRDSKICTSSSSNVVVTGMGPLFTQVKAIISANCGNSCHLNQSNSGQTNFNSDCDIVLKYARIGIRCVTQETMPPSAPLNQTLKDQITAWVNAGGSYTD